MHVSSCSCVRRHIAEERIWPVYFSLAGCCCCCCCCCCVRSSTAVTCARQLGIKLSSSWLRRNLMLLVAGLSFAGPLCGWCCLPVSCCTACRWRCLIACVKHTCKI
jgi:hypothetical protein